MDPPAKSGHGDATGKGRKGVEGQHTPGMKRKWGQKTQKPTEKKTEYEKMRDKKAKALYKGDEGAVSLHEVVDKKLRTTWVVDSSLVC